MPAFNTIISALLDIFLPVLALSTLVLYWVNRPSPVDKVKQEASTDSKRQLSETESNADRKSGPAKEAFLQRKWVQFGGGFYGMLGLLTYLHVEWLELSSLLVNFATLEFSVANIVSELLIKFIIESLLNLLTAVTWPFYWLGKTGQLPAWLSFIAAYAGYHGGQWLSRFLHRQLPQAEKSVTK